MVYNYLLDLYQVLDRRKKSIEVMMAQVSDDKDKLEYQRGRLSAVNEFKDFLSTHYHSRLPRRMQKHHR